MNKYTPGPWHIDPKSSFYVFAHGSLAEQAGVDNGPFVCNASTLANARLIAAAPDMVDLLLAALPFVEEGEQFNKSTHRNLSKQIRVLLEKIDA